MTFQYSINSAGEAQKAARLFFVLLLLLSQYLFDSFGEFFIIDSDPPAVVFFAHGDKNKPFMSATYQQWFNFVNTFINSSLMGFIAITRKDGSKAILSDTREDFIRSRNRIYPESMRWTEIKHFATKKEATDYINGVKAAPKVQAVPKPEVIDETVTKSAPNKGGNNRNKKRN